VWQYHHITEKLTRISFRVIAPLVVSQRTNASSPSTIILQEEEQEK
jgi:hypothetical protein